MSKKHCKQIYFALLGIVDRCRCMSERLCTIIARLRDTAPSTIETQEKNL